MSPPPKPYLAGARCVNEALAALMSWLYSVWASLAWLTQWSRPEVEHTDRTRKRDASPLTKPEQGPLAAVESAEKLKFLQEFGQDYGYPGTKEDIYWLREHEFSRLKGCCCSVKFPSQKGASPWVKLQLAALFECRFALPEARTK